MSSAAQNDLFLSRQYRTESPSGGPQTARVGHTAGAPAAVEHVETRLSAHFGHMRPGEADVAGFLRDISYACSFLQSHCDALMHRYWTSIKDNNDELLTLEFDNKTINALKNAVIALSLHILTTGKSEKQARVDFL